MLESRWVRRIGPGLAALGAVAVIATSTLGARDRAWDPPPCADQGGAPAPAAVPGTWWRLDPVLQDGALVGQRLAVGGPGAARMRVMDLPPASFAAGPVGGLVLVASDDGRASVLTLIDVARGCRRTVTSTPNVIRAAAVTPDGTAILEFRLERGSRREIGVVRRPVAASGAADVILGPIRPDARFGPTWTTTLTVSLDGRQVAVQSCAAIACRTRVVGLSDGAVRAFVDPSDGDVVGLADGHLVMYEACGGLPCPLVAADVATGRRVVLHDAAGQATVALGPGGRPVVIHEVGVQGGQLRAVGLDGRAATRLPADRLGRRLVGGPGRSGSAAETGPGLVVLAPDGRMPVDGPLPPIVLRLADGASLELVEGSR